MLRPGGRVRIDYEALGRYRGGEENETLIRPLEPGYTMFLATDRDIDAERALYCGLKLAISFEQAQHLLGVERRKADPTAITEAVLQELTKIAVDSMTMTLSHPGGRTLAGWLKDAGFTSVRTTHSGRAYAGLLYDRIPESERPTGLGAVDATLRFGVSAVTTMEAPPELDAPIIALR